MRKIETIGGSFRDPSGFVFVSQGKVYRQVNERYQSEYDNLMSCGLYDELVRRQLLISHSESCHPPATSDRCYKILLPEQIPFVSYPYEWSFGQIKDAALATLEIQKRALSYGMSLKDASAYNVQFFHGKPILIDTLSFDTYREGEAWAAYHQFCKHFLLPLALMSYRDIRLNQLLRIHIDGIPLDLGTSLLPKRSIFNLGMFMHVHLHFRSQRRYAGMPPPGVSKNSKRLGKQDILNICDSLRSTIDGLKWDHGRTEWADYYNGDSYRDEGFESKCSLVADYLRIANPKCVWDLGANTGVFSRIAVNQGVFTVSMDSDPGVVEANYQRSKDEQERNILPLLMDLANPSSRLGWAHQERNSLADRSGADCILALALVHHIAIGNNVPISAIAEYFSKLGEWLIIEFVPKSDKMVKQLLVARDDIFSDYTQTCFEHTFAKTHDILRKDKIRTSDRILYLLKRTNTD